MTIRSTTCPPAIWMLLILGVLALSGPVLAQPAADEPVEVPPSGQVIRAPEEEAVQPAEGEIPAETVAEPPPDVEPEESSKPTTVEGWLNYGLETINGSIIGVLFFDVSFGLFGTPMPFLVVFLALGALYFTFYHGFINVRGFRHAVNIVRGKYTTKDDPGEISPFRALTSALSATVGLGNIAGVAIAMVTGGPGALFWMMVLGLFGMSAKFHESTLAQMFRERRPDGTIAGGPMYYLDRGLREKGPALGALGKVLAIVFAIFCMGASLGGGNMFQSNQAFEGFYSQFVAEPSLVERQARDMETDALRPFLAEDRLERLQKRYAQYQGMTLEEVRQSIPRENMAPLVDYEALAATLPAEEVQADAEARAASQARFAIGFGILLSALVGFVVIGGITRIGAATSRIVPSMCVIYVVGCLVVIILNIHMIPDLIVTVLTQAFSFRSAFGGMIGAMIIGFQRAAFSSEAGLGSSAIAHSAARTSIPVREGFVASLEPFIDTIVICFLTGMTVLVTNAYIAPQFTEETSGSAVTLYAFQQTGALAGWFPAVLSISIILFAFSTMISWAYYGEQAWGYLFGARTVLIYRIIFVAFVFIGAVVSLGQVVLFADLMLLSMAFPNIIGGIILAPAVKRQLTEYWQRYKSGQWRTAEAHSDEFDI